MNKKFYLHSLTSLAILTSGVAFAQQTGTAPSLEGGVTASIGTFYAVPTADNESFGATRSFDEFGGQHFNVLNNQPGYDWGFDASLGYVFEETANSVELFYRVFNTNDDTSFVGVAIDDFDEEDPLVHIESEITYELTTFDLMISQFFDVGRHMQLRLLGGLAYVNLEQKQSAAFFEDDFVTVAKEHELDVETIYQESEFSGWGPRIATDARYEFGPGFGIVGGGSIAYYLGDLDTNSKFLDDEDFDENLYTTDDNDNHGVMNLRANLGVDYVYFFEEDETMSTLGVELGYFVDYYNDIVASNNYIGQDAYFVGADTFAVSYSGPYLSVKGVF